MPVTPDADGVPAGDPETSPSRVPAGHTRFRLTVEYDGRPFMGWQRQPHGPSVQKAIEVAVLRRFGETVTLYAAGRTDAGVHALGMTVHLDLARRIEPYPLMGALNSALRGSGVAILDCALAPPGFHARFSCIGRHYAYRIVNRPAPLALESGRAWHVPRPLDETAMHRAAQHLVGHHDFTTFRSVHCQSASPVKSLDRLDVRRSGPWIEILADARSFLHHQVRSMVGCLMLVGLGRWNEADLVAALEARDRAALGFNAPPDGLYFLKADYPPMRADPPDA